MENQIRMSFSDTILSATRPLGNDPKTIPGICKWKPEKSQLRVDQIGKPVFRSAKTFIFGSRNGVTRDGLARFYNLIRTMRVFTRNCAKIMFMAEQATLKATPLDIV